MNQRKITKLLEEKKKELQQKIVENRYATAKDALDDVALIKKCDELLVWSKEQTKSLGNWLYRIDPNTVINASALMVALGAIMKFEETGVFSSKAFNVIAKWIR